MSRYDYTDSIIKYLNKKYIDLFGNLNSVLAIDEVHVLSHPYVKPTTKKFITFFEVFRAAS